MSKTLGISPGWHIECEPFNIWDEHGLLVAQFHAPMKPDKLWDRGVANCRLANAAPSLYAACEAAVPLMEDQDFDDGTPWDRAVKALRAALALARGETTP